MAHSVPGYANLDRAVAAARREFDEMPGLTLTVDQARRLWALEPRLCSAVLRQLVDTGYLRQSTAGRYTRPSAA